MSSCKINKESQFVVNSNEDISAESLISLNRDNIEDSYKQVIVWNIEFEVIITSIKNYFFHQLMMNFVNKLYLSYQKYKTNGNVRDENYKGELLFPMKDFV